LSWVRQGKPNPASGRMIMPKCVTRSVPPTRARQTPTSALLLLNFFIHPPLRYQRPQSAHRSDGPTAHLPSAQEIEAAINSASSLILAITAWQARHDQRRNPSPEQPPLPPPPPQSPPVADVPGRGPRPIYLAAASLVPAGGAILWKLHRDHPFAWYRTFRWVYRLLPGWP
jgi:hypothetical protein